jgi:hypothetical protein
VRERVRGLGDVRPCMGGGGGAAKRDLRLDCLQEIARPHRDRGGDCVR